MSEPIQGEHDGPAAPIGVAIDLGPVRRDLSAIRTDAERAGHAIEATLLRAVRTGKLGLDDLRRTALSVLGQIAAQALKGGIASLFGKQGGGLGGGLGAALSSAIGAGLGLPGRATGGPVSPMRPYLVGERGPELFVPTASGRIERADPGAARTVNVAIRVQADGGSAPEALRRSSRQVARAVRAAIEGAD